MPSKPSWISCFLPLKGGWFFLWFVMLNILCCPQHFLNDGAVARHVLTGCYIIEHGSIPHTNYVWAINPQAPWLTHELFGDLAFGAAYLLAGLNGVALLGVLVVAAALMWCLQIALNRGLGRLMVWLLMPPVLLCTSLHWLSRSHIFSYLCLIAIYYATFLSRASFRSRLLFATLTMVVWSNFHGSFLIGLFILMLKPLCELISSFWNDSYSPRKKALLLELLIPAMALLAVTLNIRGFGFLTYVFQYVAHQNIMGKGGEWIPLDFSIGLSAWCFLGTFIVAVWLWIVAPKRPAFAEVILLTVLFLGGLKAMRLIPYFALIALPSMGPPLESIRHALAQMDAKSKLQRVCQRLSAFDQGVPAAQPASVAILRISVQTALFVLLVGAFLFAPSLKITNFPDKLPVRAANYMEAHQIHGPGFAFDNWGPYLYFRLKQPVFIDDKTDFYPSEFVAEYLSALLAGNTKVLDKYKLSYALVPPDCALAKALTHQASWTSPYRDASSILFVRKY